MRLSFILSLIFIAAAAHLYPASAQIAVRVPDLQLNVKSVVKVAGQTWLETDTGAYRLEGESFKRIPNLPVVVRYITEVEGSVWLITDQGAYRIEGDTAKRLPDIEVRINDLTEVNGKVYVATELGAYRIEGDHATRVTDAFLRIARVMNVDGQLYLLEKRLITMQTKGDEENPVRYDQGLLHHLEGETLSPVPNLSEGANVRFVEQLGGYWWAITTDGAFRIKNGVVERFPAESLYVSDINEINGQVWLSTNKGAYRVTGGVLKHVTDEPLNAGRVINVNNGVWIATLKGSYLVEGDTVRRIPDEELKVDYIFDFEGRIYIVTSEHKVLELNGDKVSPFPGRDYYIDFSKVDNGRLWLQGWSHSPERRESTPDGEQNYFGTYPNLYYYKDNLHKLGDGFPLVRDVSTFDGNTWLATNAGAYRIDEGLRLTVTAHGAESGWHKLISQLLHFNLWVGGTVAPDIRYRRVDGSEPDAAIIGSNSHLMVKVTHLRL